MERIGETALYPSAVPGAPLVVAVGEDEGSELPKALAGADCSLALAPVTDWDRDLSPWPAPAVFRGQGDFGGGAEAFLRRLTETVVPGLLAALPEAPKYLALAGYSLAGLFAVWAPFRTALFARTACVSGSLWYPGFADFIRENAPVRLPEKMYFSLGDREARTRHPLLRTSEDRAREAAELFAGMGAETVFHLNPGNHFRQATERMTKGVLWLLDGNTKEK